MLTKTLLITRFRQGKAYPHKLDLTPSNIDLAENVILIFRNSIDHKRSEIEEEIKGYNPAKTNPKVIQGLANILFKRSVFVGPDKDDPIMIRSQIYSKSAEYWQKIQKNRAPDKSHKQVILESIEDIPSIAFSDTESWLYADITSNQKLTEFDTLAPNDLIHRYNIEQVQGLLLYTQKIILSVQRANNQAFRQIMQMMKFFRLMFDIVDSDEKQIVLNIDGPSSILESSRSYGMEIAQLFPAILLFSVPWKLEATLKVPDRARNFKLEINDKNTYQSFYRKKNVWVNEKVVNLVNRFREKYAEDYDIDSDTQIIPMKNNRYLLPDFKLQPLHMNDTTKKKETLLVEWVHYLSETKISWLLEISKELPENYLFAVKGNRTKLKNLTESLGNHILIFATELTAPALKKRAHMMLV